MTGQRTAFRLVAGAIALATTAAIPIGPAAGAEPTAQLGLVALGDSYSSGEGVGPFDPVSALNGCHRSPIAWPQLWSDASSVVELVAHAACSGATTGSLAAPFKREVAQLDWLNGSAAKVVTVSIGGNDLGFAGLLSTCFIGDCIPLVDQTLAQVPPVAVQAATAYAAIQRALPTAHLVVVGYPRLAPGGPRTVRNCPWLTDAERAGLNRIADELDRTLGQAAYTAGATYVSTRFALSGHELCTTHPWLFPVDVSCAIPGFQQCAHPSLDGQRAMAAAVRAVVDPVMDPRPRLGAVPRDLADVRRGNTTDDMRVHVSVDGPPFRRPGHDGTLWLRTTVRVTEPVDALLRCATATSARGTKRAQLAGTFTVEAKLAGGTTRRGSLPFAVTPPVCSRGRALTHTAARRDVEQVVDIGFPATDPAQLLQPESEPAVRYGPQFWDSPTHAFQLQTLLDRPARPSDTFPTTIDLSQVRSGPTPQDVTSVRLVPGRGLQVV